jgi:hypothetical protein
VPQFAELAGGDDLTQPLGDRVMQVVKSFDDPAAGSGSAFLTASAWSALAVNGFSLSTCLPACRAAMFQRACWELTRAL